MKRNNVLIVIILIVILGNVPRFHVPFGSLIGAYIVYSIFMKRRGVYYKERRRDYNWENKNDGYYGNGGYYGSNKKTIIFSSSQINANGYERKYDVVFSDGRIDFSNLPLPLVNREIRVNVIFSNAVLRINEDIPAVIKVKSAFSSTRLPDNSNITFGEQTYATRSFRENEAHYYIEITSAFSNTEVFGL